MFGAKEEYALHTIERLAMAGGEPSARDLAEFEQLPIAFVRKLMTLGAARGGGSSSEGPTGGWHWWRRSVQPGHFSIAATCVHATRCGPKAKLLHVRFAAYAPSMR